MGLRKYLYLLAVVGITFAGAASADGIVRWVGAGGVTHFGNPQFAPSGEGSLIEVAATNIMDVPVAPPPQVHGAPRFVTIERPPKHNKRGWQGYTSSRTRNNPRRRNRR